MKEELIYKTDFCDLFWNKNQDTVREHWKIASCSLNDFKELNLFLIGFCKSNKIRFLIIDAFGAISLLPETHHDWLDGEFNMLFAKETRIRCIFIIIPESLVTSISINKFHESIRKNRRNIMVIKMKSPSEAYAWIEKNK